MTAEQRLARLIRSTVKLREAHAELSETYDCHLEDLYAIEQEMVHRPIQQPRNGMRRPVVKSPLSAKPVRHGEWDDYR